MTFRAVFGRGPRAAAPAALASRRGRPLAPIVPFVEGGLHPRQDEVVDFIEICQAIADGAWLVEGGMLDFSDETVERGPSGEAETDDSREEILREHVVIPSI